MFTKPPFKDLPSKLKVYFILLYSITFLSFLYFIKAKYIVVNTQDIFTMIFFIVVIALTETFTVYYRAMSFSTTFAVTTAVYILFGPFTTLVVFLLGYSIRILKANDVYKHIFNTPWYGTLFNYCILTLPIAYANFAFIGFGGSFGVENLSSNIGTIVAFSLVFFITNTLFISIMYSIMNKKGLFYSFALNARLVFINIIIMIPFGMLLAYLFELYGYLGVIFLLFPIILLRYTFSLYISSKNTYLQTIEVLMNAMEARDKYTEGHSRRVAELTETIAKELRLNQFKIDKLIMAAMLHDVGKIGIDDNILNKPGKLTFEEYEMIKQHPVIGYNILKNIKELGMVLNCVKYHHERYDGKGYPEGKDYNEIPIEIFIIQLADSVDAMATDRPYRGALTEEEIIGELLKNKGTQFHPKVVEAYLKVLKKKGSK